MLVLGLTVAAVALSLAGAVMARMRRRTVEKIMRAWSDDSE